VFEPVVFVNEGLSRISGRFKLRAMCMSTNNSKSILCYDSQILTSLTLALDLSQVSIDEEIARRDFVYMLLYEMKIMIIC
jgi:hypothetical protein